MEDTPNNTPTIASLAASISQLQLRLEDATTNEQAARKYRTQLVNQLNGLQKEFDKLVETFKRDSSVVDSHWADQLRGKK